MPSTNVPYNNYQFIGNLGKDPEVQFFESGGCVANFSVAIYRGKDKNGNEKKALWLPCKAFGEKAEAIADAFKKGDRIQVNESKLDKEEWQDKTTGQPRSKIVAIVWDFEKVERAEKPASPQPQDDFDSIPF